MASGNTRRDKDRCLSHLSGGTRKRLRAAKLLCVVVGMIAIVGLCEVTKQPSTADAAMNPQGIMQVAQLFKSREQKFREREKYLLDKLTRIRKEVRAEDGGKFYEIMQEYMAQLIKDAGDKENIEMYEFASKQISDDAKERELFFYQYNVDDVGNKKRGEYIEIPEICVARGERWCEPTVGLFVCIIDPSIPKKTSIDGARVPKADEKIGTMRIPVRYVLDAFGSEKSIRNIMVYENAMKYVYKFFEGEVSKEELDAVTTQIVDKGKHDRTTRDMLKEYLRMEQGSKEKKKMLMEIEKACYFPEVKMEREFNGNNYTIRYDNNYGYIIIDFPLN